jgi:hypothetical protein
MGLGARAGGWLLPAVVAAAGDFRREQRVRTG